MQSAPGHSFRQQFAIKLIMDSCLFCGVAARLVQPLNKSALPYTNPPFLIPPFKGKFVYCTIPDHFTENQYFISQKQHFEKTFLHTAPSPHS